MTPGSGLARVLSWRRVRFVVAVAGGVGFALSAAYPPAFPIVVVDALAVATLALVAFGVFERWPARLPGWLARWVVQIVAVAIAMPVGTLAIAATSDFTGADIVGFTALGLLISPWLAFAALVRQKDAIARHQALAFELERSELERQAVEGRLKLLQAQVAPHFLFNALANVQALVDAGSSQASAVLRSLTAYLRATVPRLHDPVSTLGDELQLVRAYLELMHLRMPDRLRYELHVDDDVAALRCPPITLLTLVENAVRHGIDPSEDGGRIDIHVERRGPRCVVRVIDTGMGLRATTDGHGTGLATLRERLALIFGDGAQLRLSENAPHGACAEIDLPARSAS